MNKIIYPIHPCPWCRKTPTFFMDLTQETWCPYFKCTNDLCLVCPQSPYISIRNTSKRSAHSIKEKIEKLINNWNKNNPITAYEGMEFDFIGLSLKGCLSVDNLRREYFKRSAIHENPHNQDNS